MIFGNENAEIERPGTDMQDSAHRRSRFIRWLRVHVRDHQIFLGHLPQAVIIEIDMPAIKLRHASADFIKHPFRKTPFRRVQRFALELLARDHHQCFHDVDHAGELGREVFLRHPSVNASVPNLAWACQATCSRAR